MKKQAFFYFFFFLLFLPVIFSAEETLFPGTVTQVSTWDGLTSNDAWVNVDGVKGDDANNANITASTYDTGDKSQYIKASNFGFSIPAYATITGVKVTIERNYANGAVKDYYLKLSKNNTSAVGNDKNFSTSNWTTYVFTRTYGDWNDTWGTTLTPAEINDVNFTVVFSALSAGTDSDAYIDYIKLTVYTGESSHFSTCDLNANAFVLAYRDDTNAGRGKVGIYNDANQLLRSIVFHDDNTSLVKTTCFSDGNFLVSWVDDENGGKSFFKVYNQLLGITTNDVLINETASSFYFSVDNFNDANVVFFYVDDGNSNKPTFQIFNRNGTQLVGEVTVDVNAATQTVVTCLTDVNFALAYRDAGGREQMDAVIYNNEGVVVTPTWQWFKGVGGPGYGMWQVQIERIDNTSFVIGYLADNLGSTDSNYGWALWNSDGVKQLERKVETDTNTSSGQSTYQYLFVKRLNVTQFGYGYVDDDNSDYGRLRVYDINGDMVRPMETFNAGTTPRIVGTSLGDSNNFVVAYANDSNYGVRNFKIYYWETVGEPPAYTYDFTISLPASCTGGQGKSTAGDGACDRCWVQPEDSLPPIDSSDLNCQGQNVATNTAFVKVAFTGTATSYDLNFDLNATPATGLSALAKCDSGDSNNAIFLRKILSQQTSGETSYALCVNCDARKWGVNKIILDKNIESVSFKLKKVGSPTGDVNYSIHNAANESLIRTEVLSDASALLTSYEWKTHTFSSPLPYVNGGTYITVDYNGGALGSNYVYAEYSNTSVNSDENLVYFNAASSPNFGVTAAWDMKYRIDTIPTITTQTICNGISGDHNVFVWLKFTNYSVANGLFNLRTVDINSGAS